MQNIISGSILSADFGHLIDDVQSAIDAGMDWIHFDVMDFHFVPNLSFGPFICKTLRDAGITIPIDVHLMVDNPDQFIEPFAKAGASMITFHQETANDVEKTLLKIKENGMHAGLAFNPDKPVVIASQCWKMLDLILLMSVFPGFSGQSFIASVLDKANGVRQQIDEQNPNIRLSMDGGIKLENIEQVKRAGVDTFVMGSGLFKQPDYRAFFEQLSRSDNNPKL